MCLMGDKLQAEVVDSQDWVFAPPSLLCHCRGAGLRPHVPLIRMLGPVPVATVLHLTELRQFSALFMISVPVFHTYGSVAPGEPPLLG